MEMPNHPDSNDHTVIKPTASDGKDHVSASRTRGTAGRGGRLNTIAVGVLVGLTALVVGNVLSNHLLGLHVEAGRITSIQDFASHTEFTRAVWAGELRSVPGSLYGVAAHLRFMQKWAGELTERALPFGYSPTMLWVLGPFSLLPLPLAYVLWSMAGLGAAIWIVLRSGAHRLIALMVFLTPVAVASTALGQTAILSTAGFFYLMNRTGWAHSGRTTHSGIGWLSAVAIVWALGAKPPLCVTAAVALLALRDGRTVLVALGLTVLTTVALVPWIGVSWPAGYLSLLSKYNLTQADPTFAWSLAPALMTNVRALLAVDSGIADAVAAHVSNLLWVAALVATIWAGRARKVTAGGVWALAVLSYLLLCSHVSFTEDLLLLLVPAATAPWTSRSDVRWTLAVWLIVPLGLVLSPAIGPLAGVRPAPLFFIKLLLLAWTLYSAVGGAEPDVRVGNRGPADVSLQGGPAT